LVFPVWPSLRAAHVTANDAALEESREVVPEPSVRDPFHVVRDSLVTAMRGSFA
jgi:hypothetical protein